MGHFEPTGRNQSSDLILETGLKTSFSTIISAAFCATSLLRLVCKSAETQRSSAPKIGSDLKLVSDRSEIHKIQRWARIAGTLAGGGGSEKNGGGIDLQI